jgi:hypothetical protein
MQTQEQQTLSGSVTSPLGGVTLAASPRAVRDVARSTGQPLDAGTRAFMEARFGHNFSRVQVHSDTRAAESADAAKARAYTVGNDIVFGRGEYAPGTAKGRRLMAHELTHVVQQWSSVSGPMLQCAKTAEARSSFGKFVTDDDKYYAYKYPYNAAYGAEITITFEASDKVDAKKIAFIQTVLTSKDGTHAPGGSKNEKQEKIQGGRVIPEGKPGAGTHIDQWADVRTPLVGMKDATDLSNPTPNPKYTETGWHYLDSNKEFVNHDAWMHDEPNISSGDRYTSVDGLYKNLSQRFETAAVAIEGNQAGTYYGSVEWGWEKGPKDKEPRLLDFKIKSKGDPSSTFMEAAKLWNASKMEDNSDPIKVPMNTS